MGIFDFGRQTVRRTEAVATIRKGFERCARARVMWIPDSHAELAVELVAQAWAAQPAVFEGREGPAPHHLSLAAHALAKGMEAHRGNIRMECALAVVLGLVLQEVPQALLPSGANKNDVMLLERASRLYFNYDADSVQLMGQIGRVLRGD